MLQLVRQAVDHDRAAGIPVVAPGVLQVRLVRVGHLDGEEEIAARIAADQAVVALRRAEVAGALLGADGFSPSATL